MTAVREVMNPNVVRLCPEATLNEAIQMLHEQDCGGAPVVSQEGVVLGFLSELSFLDALFDLDCRKAPVADFMTRQVYYVQPDDPLEHATHMFELYGIQRLPVLEFGQLVGIVTRRDLIHHVLATDELLGSPLEALLPGVNEEST